MAIFILPIGNKVNDDSSVKAEPSKRPDNAAYHFSKGLFEDIFFTPRNNLEHAFSRVSVQYLT